jgi:hypothetical protein
MVKKSEGNKANKVLTPNNAALAQRPFPSTTPAATAMALRLNPVTDA